MVPPTGLRRSARTGFLVPLGLAAALGLTASAARADRIELRGGGHLKGKVLPGPDAPGMVSVLLERGKAPVRFRKEQVSRVVPEASPLDDYLGRKATAPATAEGQYEMGLWCERAKLGDLAQVHYQAAVAADKGFAPAHLKLGHVAWGDRWLDGDEVKEAQGLVKHQGRWVTQAMKGEQEKKGALAREQVAWARRLRPLREALSYGADDRRREAESQLLALRDPAAVVPLVRLLGGDEPAVRKVLARALGNVPGPEAALALVNGLVNDPEADVRHTWLDEVGRREEPEVGKQLLKAVRSTDTEVINRAAWAIANLDRRETVPALVGALVTVKQATVWAPSSGGPAEGLGLSATFGSVPPASSSSLQHGVPVAYNGSSVGYLNGPSVGPGSVAYGATSVPLYPSGPTPDLGNPAPALAGVGINSGGGLGGSRGPVPQVVSVPIENTEVLAALIKLTGQDFGYDKDAWRRWVQASFQAEPAPLRRVPQP